MATLVIVTALAMFGHHLDHAAFPDLAMPATLRIVSRKQAGLQSHGSIAVFSLSSRPVFVAHQLSVLG
jgi:hypothetical protein